MVRLNWTLAAAGLSLAEGRHVRRADGGAADGRRLNNMSRFGIPGQRPAGSPGDAIGDMQKVSGYMKKDDSEEWDGDAWDGDGYVCRTRNECKKQATRDGASFYTDDYSNINTYGCFEKGGHVHWGKGGTRAQREEHHLSGAKERVYCEVDPTMSPTLSPSLSPTLSPTLTPTKSPTFHDDGWDNDGWESDGHDDPTFSPTLFPTLTPSISPEEWKADGWENDGHEPTFSPTLSPTLTPHADDGWTSDGHDDKETKSGWADDGHEPTFSPTLSPSLAPTESSNGWQGDGHKPTKSPVWKDDGWKGTKKPTGSPTKNPTQSPTKNPTESPTKSPTESPSNTPTESPTKNPTESPTKKPTESPTKNPTGSPTKNPTESPTKNPTQSPTKNPTESPTKNPTGSPTVSPSRRETTLPTFDDGDTCNILYFNSSLPNGTNIWTPDDNMTFSPQCDIDSNMPACCVSGNAVGEVFEFKVECQDYQACQIGPASMDACIQDAGCDGCLNNTDGSDPDYPVGWTGCNNTSVCCKSQNGNDQNVFACYPANETEAEPPLPPGYYLYDNCPDQ